MRRLKMRNGVLVMALVLVWCVLVNPVSFAAETDSHGKCAAGDVSVSLAAGGQQCMKPGAGQGFKDCQECPEMTVVPAGSFMMGAPEGEEKWLPDEIPQHKVTIPMPFAVGKFAVTFDEWDACVKDGGCDGYKPPDMRWGRGMRPVIKVNWYEAKAYVAWLAQKTGKPYRLLSEAEREYVTRAGTTTPFWWGASISTDQANYDGNYTYGGGEEGEDRHRTVAVDSFKPNPWGLYQVHGNVWDWVEDCYQIGYDGAPSDGTALTAKECEFHVLRGGSWGIDPQYLRSACRMKFDSGWHDSSFGFRVARAVTP